MTIGGAFLGGGVELVPAGSCKLVLEIRTEDGQNLATTFSVVGGGQTYTATAGSDGRAELTVPSGVTYTVTTSATGYDGLTAQTVVGDSATVRYVRFEAFEGRVKRSGDTMTGKLTLNDGADIIIPVEKGQAGAGKYKDFTFYDKGDSSGKIRRGNMGCEVGNVQTAVHLRAYKFDGSAEASLSVIQPETGDACALAPSWGIKTVDGATVGTNDESDKIVTLKMLSLDPKVAHTIGNEGINGQKSFTTPIIDPQNQSGRVSAPNSNASATPYYKIASISMDDISARDIATLTLDAEYGWSSTEHHAVTYRAIVRLGTDKVVEKVSLAKIWSSGQAFATFLKEDHWFIAYNKTQKVIEIWVKVEYDQANLNYRVRMSGRRHENFARWTIHSGYTGTGLASLPSTDDGWILAQAIDISNRMTYSTPSTATGQEIATADWSIGKFVQKSGDTMTGALKFDKRGIQIDYDTTDGTPIQINNTKNGNMSIGFSTKGLRTSLIRSNESDTNKVISLFVFGSEGEFSNYGALTCNYIKATNEFYANAPSFRIGMNDNSNKILTIAMANSLPSLVHTTGNETVAGAKSYTAITHIKSTNIANSETPSSDQIGTRIQFVPNNATNGDYTQYIGQIVPFHYRTHTSLQMYARRIINGNSVSADLGIRIDADGTKFGHAPTPPSSATSNEIVTADWVLGKVPKRTTFSTWAELNALLVNGKPGDMMCITLDYVGDSNINDFTASDVNIHAFGNFTVEELTVSSGKLTKLEAFGGGEIQYNNIRYRYFAMTGFGQMAVGDLIVWAFRVPYGGEMNLMLMMDSKVTSCTGFYVSL